MEIINVSDEVININVTEEIVNIVTETGAYPLPSNVFSVFGRVGNVVGQAGDYTTSLVTEGTNLYYTNARSRAAISENITGINYDSASGIFSMASGYAIATTASQATWDAAYNDKINSAAVTGTTTKVLTLNQQDGGTITASWTDDNTDAVTSVFGRTGAVVSANGDYTTSQVTEGTNLYFTNARVHSAISGTAPISEVSGVISIAQSNTTTDGYLSSTDWNTFNNKQPLITAGTTDQYYRGDKTFQILNTSAVAEGTNLYYTDTRSRSAISENITGIDYSNATGVFSLASGYIIPTQAMLDAKQDDLNGTGIVKSIGGTISYLTDNTANWDAAYNDKINSAAVTGTSTKTLTLNQQDGGTITASWTDIDTGLTSVGLSMPAAFSVSGSPLTSNGTLIVTGAGAASQYVRGDGTLADFPTQTGGGSSVSYYLNSSVSQGTLGGVAYRQLSKNPVAGAGTDITASTNGYIASYITDANDPSLLEVPGGNFNCEFYFSVNSNNHNPYIYAELYKYDGTTFTLLGSSQAIPEYLTSGTNLNPYYFAIPVATASLTLTDRIAIRIYVNVDTREVTLHTEDNHLCQVVTTFSKGMTSLNNLTKQVQYLTTGTSGTNFAIVSSNDTHTFNLPTASATNTGKLSSSDWGNFNTAYNDTIVSASVSGTTTKTLTLTQQDAGTITASWTDLNTDAVSSVFGRTGAVVATSGDYNTSQVTENTNLYYTEARVDANTNVAANTAARHNAVTLGTANGLSLSTQALSLAAASTSTTGALTSTDWNTFNGKQAALNGTGFVKISGTTISYDNSTYLTTSAASSTYLPLAGGTLTGALGGTSASFSSGVTFGANNRGFIREPAGDVEIGGAAGAALKLYSNNVEYAKIAPSTGFTTTLPFGGTSATFSSSVTAGGDLTLTSAATGGVIITNNNNSHINLFRSISPTANFGININGNGDLNIDETGVATRLTIKKTSGNVGIGNSNPLARLSVVAPACVVDIESSTSTQYNGLELKNGGGSFYVGQDNSSGNFYGGGAYSGNLYLSGAYPMVFFTSGTKRMQITSGGQVGINTIDGGVQLSVKSVSTTTSSYPFMCFDSANTAIFYIRSDSYGFINTSAWAYGSDRRIKENICYLTESGLEKILKLKPARFDYIDGNKNNIGWIAQDVQEVIEEAVNISNEKTGMLALKSDFIVPYLVKAIQELKAELDELKNK
jgi:hypothetical protein